MYRENVPSRLKEAREKAGLTQQELSEATGIARSTIANYENGKREPDIENLCIIAYECNKDVNWICSYTPPEKKEKGA